MFISHPSCTSAIWNSPGSQNISKTTKGESCSGTTTSKTTEDTEQYLLSKEDQPQVVAARFLETLSRPPGMAGGGQRRGISIHAVASARRLQIITIAGERTTTSVDKANTQSKTGTMGSIEEPVVPRERNLNGHPSTGLLWETRLEEVLLSPTLGNGTNMRTSLCLPKVTTVLVRTCGRYKDGWRTCVDLEDPTPLVESFYFWVGPKAQKLISMLFKPKETFFRRITTEVTTEKQSEHTKTTCQPITAWSYDMEGHAGNCAERHGELAGKPYQH